MHVSLKGENIYFNCSLFVELDTAMNSCERFGNWFILRQPGLKPASSLDCEAREDPGKIIMVHLRNYNYEKAHSI